MNYSIEHRPFTTSVSVRTQRVELESTSSVIAGNYGHLFDRARQLMPRPSTAPEYNVSFDYLSACDALQDRTLRLEDTAMHPLLRSSSDVLSQSFQRKLLLFPTDSLLSPSAVR